MPLYDVKVLENFHSMLAKNGRNKVQNFILSV